MQRDEECLWGPLDMKINLKAKGKKDFEGILKRETGGPKRVTQWNLFFGNTYVQIL